MFLKNLKRIITYFLLPIEFIFKAVIGQYSLRTIFLHSHWRKRCTGIQRERKRVDYGLKFKVSTVDIRIKQSGLKVIHSKVPSSGLLWKKTTLNLEKTTSTVLSDIVNLSMVKSVNVGQYKTLILKHVFKRVYWIVSC